MNAKDHFLLPKIFGGGTTYAMTSGLRDHQGQTVTIKDGDKVVVLHAKKVNGVVVFTPSEATALELDERFNDLVARNPSQPVRASAAARRR